MNLPLDLPTPMEINRLGFQALTKELGLAPAIRYVQQFQLGQGDYTAERQARLERDEGTLEELTAAIRARRPDADAAFTVTTLHKSVSSACNLMNPPAASAPTSSN